MTLRRRSRVVFAIPGLIVTAYLKVLIAPDRVAQVAQKSSRVPSLSNRMPRIGPRRPAGTFAGAGRMDGDGSGVRLRIRTA